MNFAYLLVILSGLGLILLLLLAKGHWFARDSGTPTPSQLQAVDVNAFRNLMDESEEAYLREHLPPQEFRKINRERMLAAVEYVRAAYHNAGILVRIAENAREATDPEVAQAAARLFDNATRLRWYAFRVVPRLYLKVLFPGISNEPGQLLDRYDLLTRQAIILGRLGSLGRNS